MKLKESDLYVGFEFINALDCICIITEINRDDNELFTLNEIAPVFPVKV